MNKLFYPILGIVLILIGVSAFLWFSQSTHITEPNHRADEEERGSTNDNLSVIFMEGYSYTYTRTQETQRFGIFGSKTSKSEIQFREYIGFASDVPASTRQYTGPQNAQELVNALDADYNGGRPKTEVSILHKVGRRKKTYSSNLTEAEIDARYPRAEWLQMLLDRGITIENFGAYSHALLQRHTLIFLEDTPNLRQLKILDIPPTDDLETYKAAYLDMLFQRYTKNQKN